MQCFIATTSRSPVRGRLWAAARFRFLWQNVVGSPYKKQGAKHAWGAYHLVPPNLLRLSQRDIISTMLPERVPGPLEVGVLIAQWWWIVFEMLRPVRLALAGR